MAVLDNLNDERIEKTNSHLDKFGIKKIYEYGTEFNAIIIDIAAKVADGEGAFFSFLINNQDYYFGYISKYDISLFGGHFVSLGGINYKFSSAIGVVQI